MKWVLRGRRALDI